MAAPPVQQFATLQQARRAAAGSQQFAMEVPQISRVASAAGTKKLKAEQWQVEAYNHVNEIGELGYVLTLMMATLAKGQLNVEERDENDNIVEPERDADNNVVITGDREKAERVLRALRGPFGDHKAIMATAGWHDQIAGELLMLGQPVEDTKGIAWEMLSVLEVVEDATTKKKVRKRSANQNQSLNFARDRDQRDEIDDSESGSDYLTRYHRPDLAYSGDPTSPLRRVAGVCREIVLLDQLKETMIKSRLANQIVLVPEEMTFPNPDDNGIEDVDGADRFLEMLVAHMSAPVEDRRSAAGLVPMVIRCPAELIEKWKLFGLTDGALDLEMIQEARNDALFRLAAGIELPLERMQGMGSTNHWSAAAIDADEIRKHIIPLGERLARFFTVSYMRRMMVAYEEVDEKTAERFSLAYDGSEILARAEAAQTAEKLHDKILLSDAALVDVSGFDPDQVMPTDEERNRRLLESVALIPSANNKLFLPGVIDFEQFEGIDPEQLEKFLKTQNAPVGMAPVSEDEDQDEDEPEEEDEIPGGPAEPAVGEPDSAEDFAILERVRTAASFALDAALKYASNQVCSSKLTADTKAKVNQPHLRSAARKPEVLRMITPADWKALNKTPEQALGKAWDEFNQQAVMWLCDLYTRKGHDPLSADEQARRASSAICNHLQTLALSAFKKPVPKDRDGFAVSVDTILEHVAVRT